MRLGGSLDVGADPTVVEQVDGGREDGLSSSGGLIAVVPSANPKARRTGSVMPIDLSARENTPPPGLSFAGL